MFQLLRGLSRQELVLRQAPAFAGAFIIAGAFYTFHSFYLECLAFLMTWFALDAAIAGIVRVVVYRPSVVIAQLVRNGRKS